MKSRLKCYATMSFVVLFISSCVTSNNAGQAITIDDFYDRFINHITTNMPSEYDLKFAVLTFESTKKDDTESEELGIYLAESIASKVSMNIAASTLFERENLEILLQEHDLNLSGYIDSDQAMEVGKLVPVNALLTGKYTILNNTVTINCRLIDVNTGEILIAYYDSVELSKDLSSLSGKEWVEEEKPEIVSSKRNTSNNGSLFFSSSLRVDEEILPFEFYTMIAEDKQNDFSKSYANGVSDDPAGDIERVFYAEDEDNYYFKISFYDEIPLDDINVNFYFSTPESKYAEYGIYLNHNNNDIETFVENPNEGAIKVDVDRNIRFKFYLEVDIQIPKRIFYDTPTGLLIQTRTLDFKEIDRLQIDMSSNFSSNSNYPFNLTEAEPIIDGSKIGFKIPEKKIIIDGNGRDWGNINPVYLSRIKNEGDESKQIKAIYVAKDDEYLYLRMDVLNNKPLENGIVYVIKLLSGADGAIDDLDLGYRIGKNTSNPEFNKYLSDGSIEGINVPASFGDANRIVEMKYPLTWIENKNEIRIRPYIYSDKVGQTDILDELFLFF